MNSRKEWLKLWSRGTKIGVMRCSPGASEASASTSSTVSSGAVEVSRVALGMAIWRTTGARSPKQRAQVRKPAGSTSCELRVATRTPEPSSPRERRASTPYAPASWLGVKAPVPIAPGHPWAAAGRARRD